MARWRVLPHRSAADRTRQTELETIAQIPRLFWRIAHLAVTGGSGRTRSFLFSGPEQVSHMTTILLAELIQRVDRKEAAPELLVAGVRSALRWRFACVHLAPPLTS